MIQRPSFVNPPAASKFFRQVETTTASESQSCIDNYYNSPDTTEPFYGQVEQIRQILQPSSPNVTRSVVLLGISGIGKTKMALQYANKYCKNYTTIRFFNASSEEELRASIETFYDALNNNHDATLLEVASDVSGNKCQAIKLWYEHQQGWLIILDNVTLGPDSLTPNSLVPNFIVSDYFPRHGQGHQILTGLSRRILDLAIDTSTEIQVSAMAKSDAIQMLTKIGKLHDLSARELEDAGNVVEELDSMPFFIKMAAKYMRNCQCRPNDYLEVLQKQKADARLPSPMGHMSRAFVSWEMNYQTAREHEDSMLLLKVFAFLDGSRISRRL